MKILVTIPEGYVRDTFFTPPVMEKFSKLGEIYWNDLGRQFTPEELRDRLPGIDCLMTGWGIPTLTKDILSKADSLKVIAHTAGSVADIFPEFVFDLGIPILTGNSVFAESVAEGTLAYAMTAFRNIPYYNRYMLDHGWTNGNTYTDVILDKKVALIGFGAIAKNVVKLLQPFRAEIKVWADFLTPEDEKEWGIKKVTAEEAFSTCNIISVHTSLTQETYHSINRDLLKLIQPGSVFINTARGKIVDEKALTEELETGRFQAVLDVFEEEPLPLDSRLRTLPNAILIPHMGGPTIGHRQYVTRALIEDLERIKDGKEPERMMISKEAAARMTKERAAYTDKKE